MASFSFVRDIAAAPETVFAVLTDHRGYADITPTRKAALEREGEPAPNGVGAIRVLTVAGLPLREEVTVYEAPTRFAYTVLSGLPVRDHVGTVDLTAVGSGTRMTYVVQTTPTVPLAGAALVAGLRLGVKFLVDGIVKESERRDATHG